MKINKSIFLLIKTYLLVLSVFLIFRLILFFVEFNHVNFSETSLLTIFQAFIMGLRFDIVISGYLLSLPAFLLMIAENFRIKNTFIKTFSFYWTFVFFTIAFIISAVDIPYFGQFYERFSIGAFEWFDNFGMVASMILEEPKYFSIIIPFAILEFLFFIMLKKIFRKPTEFVKIKIIPNIVISLLFLGLMFAGIRGRIENKSPIRVGTAYFCSNSFLNKLGLNPFFTLGRSYLNSLKEENTKIHLIEVNTAIKNVQTYLKIDSTAYNSPIARKIVPDTIAKTKPNIVLIIMESMSAAKMSRYGNTNNLTPFLDSLANESIYFENLYTSGKHTFNGIFSTLCSFPAIYRRHTMKQIAKYDGLSSIMLNLGYSTTYFTTHDSQFDNIEGFLRANDFQNIVSQANYPKNEIKSTWGVPDDYMFRFSIPIINKLSNENKPFFVTFMTVSDHGPFYIPEYFNPKSERIENQAVEYADWSLKQFITMAKKQTWFDSTIFVFVADHGGAINVNYDIPLNYFHAPLLYYAPKIITQTKIYKKIASQMDVFPTLMGILKLPYINNTLGIDLIKENRKYAIINNDDKIGIIDTTYFCIMKNNGNKLELYKHKNNDQNNYFEQNKKIATEMAEYAKSNMQVYQNMMLKKQITLKN